MNLMLYDVINAQNVLAVWGISPEKISIGWHEGEMSLILEYEEGDDALKDHVLTAIETLTTVSLPIVIRKQVPAFHFNFHTAP
jgi:hypothetical protein